MRRILAALTALAVLSGCTQPSVDGSPSPGGPGSIKDIVVGASDTFAPSLAYTPGLVYSRSETIVVWDGTGEALVPGETILLNIYAEALDDGTALKNTFDGLPEATALAPELLGRDLYEHLINVNVGARLLHVAVAPKDSDQEDLALVIDVLPTRAVGNDVGAIEGLPTVVRARNGEPSLVFTDDELPPEVTSATLVQGTGQQVRPGSHVLVHYKGYEWDTQEEFISTWALGTAPYATVVGEGRVILAWDEGLLDKTAGSQVLIIAPPTAGYPDRGTTVFIVDVLYVWNPDPS